MMLVSLLLLGGARALAEEPAAPAPSADLGLEPGEQAGVIPGVTPGPRPSGEEVDALAQHIGSRLRCPVCQGLSVADSTSPAAVNMQRRIKELVAAGYTQEDIEDFFIERYGEWILLAPPIDRRNLLIYAGPGLMLGAGLAWVVYTVFLWRKEPDEVPLPSDVGSAPKDRYEQRLLAELED